MAINESGGVTTTTTTTTVQDVTQNTGNLGDSSVSPGAGQRIKAGFNSMLKSIGDFFKSLPEKYENWQEGRAVKAAGKQAQQAANNVAADLAKGTVTSDTAKNIQTLYTKAERSGQDPKDFLGRALLKLDQSQLKEIAKMDVGSLGSFLKQSTTNSLLDTASRHDALCELGFSDANGDAFRNFIPVAENRIDDFSGDLHNMANLARLGQSRDTSSGNPTIIPEALSTFFADNFDACISEDFWSHSSARSNVDNFASTLSLTVLDRIQNNGEITQKDIADLQAALQPYESEEQVGSMFYIPPPPDLATTFGDNFVGELTDEKLSQLTQVVYDRFMGEDASYLINMSGDDSISINDTFRDNGKTGEERLNAMKEVHSKSLSSQYMGSGNLIGPYDQTR